MILPDVNILVYAFRREAPQHEVYAAWLTGLIGGKDSLALHDIPLLGLLRIVTNPRIVATPAPAALALAFVERLVRARRAYWLPSGPLAWTRIGELAADDRGVVGNLVPDAFLAALALTHGCRLATADRGFARFPGLDWFDPAG